MTTRSALIVTGLVCTMLLVAACGNSSSPGSTSSSAAASGKPSFSAFSSCLKKHGANLPFGNSGPPQTAGGQPPSGSGQSPPQGGFQLSAKLRKAMRACASLRPQFGSGGSGGFTPPSGG
jgi:hypothetical protein